MKKRKGQILGKENENRYEIEIVTASCTACRTAVSTMTPQVGAQCHRTCVIKNRVYVKICGSRTRNSKGESERNSGIDPGRSAFLRTRSANRSRFARATSLAPLNASQLFLHLSATRPRGNRCWERDQKRIARPVTTIAKVALCVQNLASWDTCEQKPGQRLVFTGWRPMHEESLKKVSFMKTFQVPSRNCVGG